LHTHDPFPVGQHFAYMHDPPFGFEIMLVPPRHRALLRDANLQIRSNGHVKPGPKRGSSPAQVFAGGIFFESEPARVSSPHA
jgi:hypothetical protein